MRHLRPVAVTGHRVSVASPTSGGPNVSKLSSTRHSHRIPHHKLHSAAALVIETLETRRLLSLTVDLRLPGGGKAIEVDTVGQEVNLEIWATVDGANASTTDEGL